MSLWCPDWPMVAAGVEPSVPAVVLHANRVLARTRAAAVEGVALGQRRREAQRHCPDLLIVRHDPPAEAEAFEPVLRAVGRFTPRLEVVEPGWVHLAARGPSRYFGGDASLAARLLDAAAAAAYEVGPAARVHVGVADGRFAAAVAARLGADAHRAGVDVDPEDVGPEDVDPGGACRVVEPGGSAAFLAALDVGWLHRLGEVDPRLVDLFARLGALHLGELAALDAASVLARFGAPGRHAHRLATGLDPRLPDAAEPPRDLRAEQVFDEPVDRLDPLVFAAKALADDLVARLAGNGLACTRLAVVAETDHGERDERTWYRAAGLRSPEVVERVRWQLASWLADGGPTAGVVVLRLQPVEVRGGGGEQSALWGGTSEADERAVRAVARLTSLVGDQAVLVPAWRGGRLPAARDGWTPAAAVDLLDRRDRDRRLDPDGAPWPGSLPAPSPTVVLAEPEPAVLAGEDGRPLRVGGRGDLDGEPVTLAVADRVPLLVTGWAGPWVVDERWWDRLARRRLARLQVACENGSAYLIAAEKQRWWLLAAYR
mgnify:CR=1 FL=1